MAYVDNRWLERQEREDLIGLLKERARKLNELRKQGRSSDYHIEQLLKDTHEIKRLTRIHTAENDVAFFTYEYLSDGSNQENEDNIIRHSDNGIPHDAIDNIAKIHREFFNLCDHVDHVEKNARLAIAAARGHSKSGMFSNSFPLHQTVYRKRKYILVISETDSLSKKLIGWVNKQLKFNRKLRDDFGPLLHEKNTQNEKDNEEAFITSTNTLIEASSSGKQLRGKRHGSYRPDLVIVDDPSSVNNEGTAEARDKLIHWFNSVVLPIGQMNTAFIVVGTMVSATGLLKHVLSRKDFMPSFHGAIISEPKNVHLWDEYCRIYAQSEDMTEPNRFYAENKEVLEEGIQLAWPWRWDYRKLMHEKVNMGNRAYSSEYLNRAISDDELVFNVNSWTYYSQIEADERNLTFYAAWDLAFTKNKRSDYNAIVTIARDNRTGILYVWDVWATRCQASDALKVALQKIEQFKPRFFAVETVQAQIDLANQLQEQMMKHKMYYTALKKINNRTRKEERIESLQPLFENGILRPRKDQRMFIEQAETYPGDHDDILDSCQMAVELASRQKQKRVFYTKPAGL